MPHVSVPYVTLAQLRTYRNPTGTDDDRVLSGFGQRASRIIDVLCRGRRFYPWVETRLYDHPQRDYPALELGYDVGDVHYAGGGSVLAVDEDLLAVRELKTQGGKLTIASTGYFLLTRDGRYTPPPYDLIKLNPQGNTPNFLIDDQYEQANRVTGVWGYHEGWADAAWEDTGDTVQDGSGLTTAAATITVSDAGRLDLYGSEPVFQAQQLLQLEDEYVFVRAVTIAGTANTLTVVRGVNGTTAAIHAHDTPLYAYRPLYEIVQAATRLASWLYQQQMMPTEGSEVAVTPYGAVAIPSRLPKDILEQVLPYRK